MFALNRDAQVWGWFDVDDGRHWPAAMQDAAKGDKGKAARTLPRAIRPKTARMPDGLSLEKLSIAFENNLYDARPWQGLFHWGVDWRQHKKYLTLADVHAELNLDNGGRWRL